MILQLANNFNCSPAQPSPSAFTDRRRRRLRRREVPSSILPFIVASAARTRNKRAFAVVCKVKSKKLWTRTAKHPAIAPLATPRRNWSSLARLVNPREIRSQQKTIPAQLARIPPSVKNLQVIIVYLLKSHRVRCLYRNLYRPPQSHPARFR